MAKSDNFFSKNPDAFHKMLSRRTMYIRRAENHHNKKKTHCKNGHIFSVENTYFKVRNGLRSRICRECGRVRENIRLAALTEKQREERRLRINERRALIKVVKTHCKRGHEFVSENTAYIYIGKRKVRNCLKCRKAWISGVWCKKRKGG